MIDFRYHIVTIVAIFLALGLGLLVGTSVVAPATVDAIEGRLRDLQSSLRETRDEATQLRRERDATRDIVGQLTPWVLRDRLAGRPVITITEGGPGRWRESVRDGFARAGATLTGSITLTGRWKLDVEGSAAELDQMARATVGPVELGPKQAEASLELLGRRFLEADGQTFLRQLAQARFVDVAGAEPGTTWPPRDAVLLVLASAYSPSAPQPHWLAAFSRGSATVAPTLVVGGSHADFTTVAVLRQADDLPKGLVTFDAGASPSGALGSVVALQRAIDGLGGHFGEEPGHRLLPEPA